MLRSFMILGCCLIGYWASSLPAAEQASIVHSLEEFGPIAKPAEITATYQKAVEQLRSATGGVLVVPSEAWKVVNTVPLQTLTREPAAPAETKKWKTTPGVTVLTSTPEQVVLHVPPLSGMLLEREMRLPDGDSLPHWGTHPMIKLDNHLVYGSVSYLDWIQEPVEKGNDRRFYVATIRGLRPGHFLNIHGGPGYGGGVTRSVIKSLGYDKEKQMHYVVADTSLNHVAGAIMQNKSNTGLIHMLQRSHNDNQTYDVKIIRDQYAHGDTYMYYGDFNYMSNVHSAAGDENGNVFAAFIRSKDNNFRGKVEKYNREARQLVFAPSANVDTLGDSRPLINLNPNKALSAGRVWIVPAHCYTDTTDDGSCQFQGKSYPSSIGKNPRTGTTELRMGGLIRGDRDTPWTRDIVGRFFAVNDPNEKTPKGNFRWYEISSFKLNEDGTKDIEIRRYWWGAKSAGSPTLYQRENYSWDGHERPLPYIIAPGAYVNDVSRALAGGDRGGQRTLGVAPSSDDGQSFDFEPGDAIEQAIGPDPFKPQAMRVWMWEDVPGPFPSAVFDLANNGAASRFSAMTIAGGGASLDDSAKRREQKPAWDNVLVLNAATGVGINCRADFAEAAILFQQPFREQPIRWHYDQQEGKAPKKATLTVSRESGELNFDGGGIGANGAVSKVQGLSGDATPARNLRGKNVPVAANATSLKVTFPTPETDADYAVFIEQSWIGQRAISDKTPEGFTINFAGPAPAKATIDWMLVR